LPSASALLIEECWQRKILLTGIIKDSASRYLTRNYPGFITEAARNAGQDWITQDTLSTEDTTKIRCIAIPTNLEIVEQAFSPNGTGPQIQEESNLPMVGHEVHLLDPTMTEQVANLSLDLEQDTLIHIGALVRDENVRVYLRV
jgi:hypothetical protein